MIVHQVYNPLWALMLITMKNPIWTSQTPSYATAAWSSRSRHVGLAWVHRGTSLVGIPLRCSFRSEIQGVVPCTPVPQARLAGMHSLHPSDVSATPLLQLPRAKLRWSSSSRPTQMFDRSWCCVSMQSLSLLTGPFIGWPSFRCCTWPSVHQLGPMFHFPLMRASLLASQKANRVLLRFCVALRLTHFRYTDHVRIMMRHVLVVSEAQYWVLLVGRLA